MKDTPWVGIATTRGGVRVLNQREVDRKRCRLIRYFETFVVAVRRPIGLKYGNGRWHRWALVAASGSATGGCPRKGRVTKRGLSACRVYLGKVTA